MRFAQIEIVLQEVPGEVSICFSITGCPLHCDGCHSPYLWKKTNGELLTTTLFRDILLQYKGFATCVLFMGGEWEPQQLEKLLKIAKIDGYKTCLYSGYESIPQFLEQQLTYIKTGAWNKNLKGLDHPNTNQKFTEVATGKNLNHLFIRP